MSKRWPAKHNIINSILSLSLSLSPLPLLSGEREIETNQPKIFFSLPSSDKNGGFSFLTAAALDSSSARHDWDVGGRDGGAEEPWTHRHPHTSVRPRKPLLLSRGRPDFCPLGFCVRLTWISLSLSVFRSQDLSGRCISPRRHFPDFPPIKYYRRVLGRKKMGNSRRQLDKCTKFLLDIS